MKRWYSKDKAAGRNLVAAYRRTTGDTNMNLVER